MTNVRSVSVVSDGIVVDFLNGTTCYFPASLLFEQIHDQRAQVLLGYDPSDKLAALPEVRYETPVC